MSSTLTPKQVQYLRDHIDESLVSSIHISSGICVLAATVSVILRCLARHVGGTRLGRDDYCIFIAYILYVGFASALGTATRYGEGRHVIVITDFRTYAIINLLQASFYMFSMASVKGSILLLYHRIFPSKPFRNALLVTGVIVFIWALAGFFLSIFDCFPVDRLWDSTLPGHCIDYGAVNLVISILNIILDFTILGLPMPLLWKLHMSTRRKALLSGLFAFGCVACVVSVARLFYAKQAAIMSPTMTTSEGSDTSIYDPSWHAVWPGIISGLEICTGIVACCAITYGPLVGRFLKSPAKEHYRLASSAHGFVW